MEGCEPGEYWLRDFEGARKLLERLGYRLEPDGELFNVYPTNLPEGHPRYGGGIPFEVAQLFEDVDYTGMFLIHSKHGAIAEQHGVIRAAITEDMLTEEQPL